MSFDGFFLHHMVNELQSELLNGRIQKINQPFEQELVLQIRSNRKNQKLLLSSHSVFGRIQRTQTTFENPAFPNTFIMVMRKYLQGAVIEQIQQLENDRILEIAVSNKNEIGDDISVTLIIEIMGKHSNIILLDKATGKIIEAIKHVGFSQNSYRTILPGSTYVAPPKTEAVNPFTIKDEALFAFLHREELTPKNLQAHFQGLGRDTAQELASRLESGEKLKTFRAFFEDPTDPRLTKKSFAALAFADSQEESFETLSDLLDHYYLDKAERDRVQQQAGELIRKADNSVWADLTAEGLDQKLLLRSDGTSVYMTQDIGTAEMRFNDYPIDKMVYVVGNEQNYHFQVLSILLDKLGFEWGKSLVHFSYGMVELPNGKMKSREGTVVDADDLIAEMKRQARQTIDAAGKFGERTEEEKDEVARIVGLGALKYFLLKVDARKNMLFNPAESIDFNGNTGPFIQYTYARIRSILRKAEAEQMQVSCNFAATPEISTKEEAVVQHLSDFASVVRQAGEEFAPNAIANYCYELAKEYNQFYHDYKVLGETDENKRQFRLVLSRNVAKVLRLGMGLLGIEMPERM